jgi:monoterpene epsilon-lactone hydrolase
MSSKASQQIRAQLINRAKAPDLTPQKERAKWDQETANAPLPEGTHIESGVMGGVPSERVTVGDIGGDNVIVLVHGGGFNSGSSITHRHLAARLSLAAGVHVLTFDYRLAPEHPFPAGLDDALTVYRSLISGSTRPGQIILFGDSSGANLAVAMLLVLRAHGDPPPRAAVLTSPWLDLSLSGESIRTHRELDPVISPEGLQKAVDYYLNGNDNAQPTDPLVSPLFTDLTGLPPMLIQVGDQEILLSDALRFAEKAEAAGVQVTLEVWPQMWHTWHGWASTLPEAQEAIDAIGQYVRKLFSRKPLSGKSSVTL